MASKTFWAISLSLVSGMFLLHLGAGDIFPISWDDELYYILQAKSFFLQGTLNTPELLVDRPLLTKPPGWPILLSFWGRLFGFELGALRALSYIFFACSALLALSIVERIKGRACYTIGTGLLFLSPQATMTANIARMDGLVLCMSLLSMSLALKGRLLLSGAVALSIAHFHFNALWILVGCLVTLSIFSSKVLVGEIRRHKIDLLIAIVVLVSLLFPAYWFWLYWDGFYADFIYDLTKKFSRLNISFITVSLSLLVMSGGAFYIRKIRQDASEVILCIFGFSFIVLYVIGQEPWYEVFAVIGIYFLILHISHYFHATTSIILALVVAALLSTSAIVKAEGKYGFLGMNYEPEETYLTKKEQRDIKAKLKYIKDKCFPQKTMTLKFPFQGTALYFQELISESDVSLRARLSHAHLESQHADVNVYLIKEKFVPEWLLSGFAAELGTHHDLASVSIKTNSECVREHL